MVNNSTELSLTLKYGTQEQVRFGLLSQTVLGALAFFGDSLILLVLFRKPQLLNQNSFVITLNLLLCMAVSMTGITLLNSIAQAYDQDQICYAAGYLTYIGAIAASLNSLLLSMERYMVLAYELTLERLITRRRLLILLSSTWVFTIIVFLPFLVTPYGSFGFEDMQLCGLIFNSTFNYAYGVSLLTAVVLICSGGSNFCIMKIVTRIRTQKAPFGLTKRIIHKVKAEVTMLIVYGSLPLLLHAPFLFAKTSHKMELDNNRWIGRIICAMYTTDYMLTPFVVLFSQKEYYLTLGTVFDLRRRWRNSKTVPLVEDLREGTRHKWSRSKTKFLAYFIDPRDFVR